MKPIKTNHIWTVSHNLKSLAEILGKLSTGISLQVSGYSVTNELTEEEIQALDAIRVALIRRRAAPFLQTLIEECGVEVEVGFDYADYLPKESTDVFDQTD